jgi:4-hydroxybutyrate dehydrogenase
MDQILKKDSLREQNITEDELEVFTRTVIATQQRLLKNNYVELDEDDILNIYKNAF